MNPTQLGATSHPGCLAHAGFPPVSISLSPIPSSPSLNPSHPPSVSPPSAPLGNLSSPGSSFDSGISPSSSHRCHYPSITNTTNSVLLPPLRSFHPARTAVERLLGIPLSFSRSLRGFPISPSFSSSRCIARPVSRHFLLPSLPFSFLDRILPLLLSSFSPLLTYPIVSNGLNFVRESHIRIKF